MVAARVPARAVAERAVAIEIGLGLVTAQVPPGSGRTIADEYADTLALARTAEACGFDAVWASEHHGAEDGYLPSVLVLLAAIASVTDRLLLGTGVALAPFQHPLRFAEDCAVVDQLSRGRLVVGLGAGWRKAEFDAFGVPFAERVARTVEVAKICRMAWDRGRVTFHGAHYAFEDAAVTPKPFGRIPLLLGGTVPAAARRAAAIGDGYLGTPMNRIEEFRAQTRVFDEAARAAGREPQGLPIGFHVNAWVSPDGSLPEDVRRAMWHQIGTYQEWHARDAGAAPAGLPPVDDALIRARSFLGRPADIVEQARPWISEFGRRDLHVIVRLHYPGMRLAGAERAVRLFGAEVIPALRRIAERGS